MRFNLQRCVEKHFCDEGYRRVSEGDTFACRPKVESQKYQ